MLLPILTLATPVAEIESRFLVQFQYTFLPEYRFTENMKLPVITHESDKFVKQLTWGIQLSNKKNHIKYPWVPVEGILKKPNFRVHIRNHRCICLTNCFYARHGSDVLMFYDPSEKIICLAGIWKTRKGVDNKYYSEFAVLTRSAPNKYSLYLERTPVILSFKRIRRFLNPGQPLMDISRMIGESHYPDLYARVLNAGLLKNATWNREDLSGTGNTLFKKQESPSDTIFHTRNYFW